MDMGTGLAVLGGAGLGKEMIVKMLGPTADYLGEEVKSFAEKRVNNLKNIFQNASNKVNLEEEGTVPPKVLRGILNDGSFADDLLSTEYFGGILASSRTGISRDDRGAYIIGLISGLSSYQLRAHYVFYTLVKQLYEDSGLSILLSDRDNMEIYIPTEVFVDAMEFDGKEDISSITPHIFFGLLKEELIGAEWSLNDTQALARATNGTEKHGILFTPSALGVELYLWAYGQPHKIHDFLDSKFSLNPIDSINIPNGAKKSEK